mmetsp:Transcript_134224/g.267869  ORF Transcript_134224/g.267869 Transcript_134224/m.267869 type:complete len:227 (-) Transcript_134224:67-747(-)
MASCAKAALAEGVDASVAPALSSSESAQVPSGEWMFRTRSSSTFTRFDFAANACARPVLRSCCWPTAASNSVILERSHFTSPCKLFCSSATLPPHCTPESLNGARSPTGGTKAVADELRVICRCCRCCCCCCCSSKNILAAGGGGAATGRRCGRLRRCNSTFWPSQQRLKSSICCSLSCSTPAKSSSSLYFADIIIVASSSLVFSASKTWTSPGCTASTTSRRARR